MSELVRFLVSPIVRNPDAVRVNEIKGEAAVLLELTVDPSDLDRVRGPDGETLQAIRTVLSASAGRRKAVLELVDPSAESSESEDSSEDQESEGQDADSSEDAGDAEDADEES